MIDIRRLRDNPDIFIKAARDKHIEADIERLLEIDRKLKEAKTALQEIATEKNRIGKSVPQLSNDEKAGALAKLAELKQQEDGFQNEAKALQPEFDALMSIIRTASILGLGGSTPNKRGRSPFSTQCQNLRSAVTIRC